jgi:hypothetical protein
LHRKWTRRPSGRGRPSALPVHGQTGKGDTDKGKELKVEDMTAAKYQGKKDADLKKAVLEGVKADGKEVMPHFKD